MRWIYEQNPFFHDDIGSKSMQIYPYFCCDGKPIDFISLTWLIRVASFQFVYTVTISFSIYVFFLLLLLLFKMELGLVSWLMLNCQERFVSSCFGRVWEGAWLAFAELLIGVDSSWRSCLLNIYYASGCCVFLSNFFFINTFYRVFPFASILLRVFIYLSIFYPLVS